MLTLIVTLQRGHMVNNTMGVKCKKASPFVDRNNNQLMVL